MKNFKLNGGGVFIIMILAVYIGCGIAAVTTYAREGRAGDEKKAAEGPTLQAEAPVEESEDDDVMSESEYEEFMRIYGSASTETETEKPAAQRTEDLDLDEYRDALEESRDNLAKANEMNESVSSNDFSAFRNTVSGNTVSGNTVSGNTISGNLVSGNDASTPGSGSASLVGTLQEDEDADVIVRNTDDPLAMAEAMNTQTTADRKYYTYTVSGIGSSLTLHKTKTQKNDDFGNMPEGYTGYIIQDPEKNDKRTLIIYQGKVGYGSNMYLKKTEISKDEYPEALLSITADDAGKTLLNGEAAGPLEKK